MKQDDLISQKNDQREEIKKKNKKCLSLEVSGKFGQKLPSIGAMQFYVLKV